MLEYLLLHPVEASTAYAVGYFFGLCVYLLRPLRHHADFQRRVNIAIALALLGLLVLTIFIGLSDGYLHTRAVLGWSVP